MALGGNQLASVPEALGNLTALTRLYLWGIQFAPLPDWIGNLTNLTMLDLGSNHREVPGRHPRACSSDAHV
jgi:internalin A